jgi:hypothetical protein
MRHQFVVLGMYECVTVAILLDRDINLQTEIK